MQCVRRSRLLFLFCALALACATTAARDVYVDGRCSTQGDGSTSSCATTAGGPGAYNDLETAMNDGTAGPGDTVFIAGPYRYISTAGSGVAGGFHWTGQTGAPGNHLTFTATDSSNRPTIASATAAEYRNGAGMYVCSNTGSGCTSDGECGSGGYCVGDNPALSFDGLEHATISNLIIEGGLYLEKANDNVDTLKDLEITGNDFVGAWTSYTSGNAGAIVGKGTRDVWVHHNVFRDTVPPDRPANWFSSAYIHIIRVRNWLIEYNTFRDFTIGNHPNVAPRRSVKEKFCVDRTTFRYNLNIMTGGYEIGGGVNPCTDANGSFIVGGGRYYGNVFYNGGDSPREGMLVLAGNTPGAGSVPDHEIYNNTFDNAEEVRYSGNTGQYRFYNNIFRNIVKHYTIRRPATNHAGDVWDYNIYTSGHGYGPDSTLQNRRNYYSGSNPNLDAHSQEATCSFVSPGPPDYDYRMNGGPCVAGGSATGKEGGVSSGANVEQGAFGVTDCVGASCAGGSGGPGGGGGGGGTSDPVGDVDGLKRDGDTKN